MPLEIQDLHAGYGNINVLHGISFRVERGEIVTLIGANGAGKTTALAAIARIPPPEGPRVIRGAIRYQNISLMPIAAHRIVSDFHMALAPEGRHIFGNLTVAENLKLATFARKNKTAVNRDYDRVYGLFPQLTRRRGQRSETLSGGEQQMLTVGRAIMTGCDFLLLDEPSMGLAPVLMMELFQALGELNRDGMTILLIEQNAGVALKFAHRGYVLDAGRIAAEGEAASLRDNPGVKKAYLGG